MLVGYKCDVDEIKRAVPYSKCVSDSGCERAGAGLQVLVGNKCDMDETKRAVPYSKGQALADEFGIQFFETSAKSNVNVDEVGLSDAGFERSVRPVCAKHVCYGTCAAYGVRFLQGYHVGPLF